MKFKQLLELLKTNYEKFSKIEAEKKQDTIEGIQVHKNSKYLYKEYSEKITRQICQKYGYEKVVAALKESDQKALDGFYIKGLQYGVKDDKELHDQLNDLVDGAKNNDERKEKYQAFFETLPKEKQDLLLALKEEVTVNRLISVVGTYDYESIENIYKTVANVPLEEIDIEMDENEFIDAFETPIFADNHPYNDKINEIVQSLDPEKDIDKISALMDANEFIVEGIEKYYNRTSEIAENYGKASDRYTSEIVDQQMEKMGIGGKIIQNTVIETNNDEITKILDDKLDPNFKINDYIKEEIISTSKFIKENGILESGVVVGEEEGKVYSMRSLVTKASELKTAIDEKRLDDVVRLTEEYKKLDEAYTEITDKLSTTSKYIYGNISSSRVASVPSKYRNNYIGVSKLTSIWMLNKMCEDAGTTIEEMMEKPFETVKKIGEKALDDYSPEKYMPGKDLKEVIDDVLANSTSSGYYIAKSTFPKLSQLTGRSIGAIQYFGMNVDNNAELAAQLSISTAAFLGTANNLTNDKNVKGRIVENFILSEAKDRNLITMSTDVKSKNLGEKFMPFDREAYINSGKTTVDAILSRMVELGKDPEGRYAPYIKNAATFLKTAHIKKTSAQKSYINTLSKGESLSRTDLQAIEAKTTLAKETEGKNLRSLKDLSETIKSLADMRNEYYSRGFFKRIFNSETRRINNEIKNIENMVASKTKLTNEQVKNAVNNVSRDESYDLTQVKINNLDTLDPSIKESTLENISRFKIDVDPEMENVNSQEEKEEEYEMFLEGLETKDNIKDEKEIQ